MKFQLPEPHVFGQGDALACLVIWLMGIMCLMVFGADWYMTGAPDWFIAMLGAGSVTAPFGLMLYKANLQIKYEDSKK